ncbi:MAG: hypothetical protein EAZ24_07035 [Burkholderiales bacterium]|nr:MAG: hypothetical protein EAZ24_07035 [Burkholderiales bacterium]
MDSMKQHARTNAATLDQIRRRTMCEPIAPRSRADAIAILSRRIDFYYWPRWSAFWIACGTALSGLAFSAILWRVGLEEMTWRYPLATLLSYFVLLALLRTWSKRDWDDGSGLDLPTPSSSSSSSGSASTGQPEYIGGGGGDFGGAGASGSFESVSAPVSAFDAGSTVGDTFGGGLEVAASAEEGAVVAIPLFLILALLLLFGGFAFSLVSLVWNAPSLLAHLMLDAGTASMLAVYTRPTHRESWLSTAFWQTFPKFLCLAIVLMVAGFALELFDPTAITLFDVLANR